MHRLNMAHVVRAVARRVVSVAVRRPLALPRSRLPTVPLLLAVCTIRHLPHNSRRGTHSHADARRCWHCREALVGTNANFSCHHCGRIQPPRDDVNFFDLFGLPPRFEVDEKRLEKLFKDLQWKLHPDKHTMATLEERTFSALQSSRVNEAFKTLQSPLLRGLYMLKLNGITIEERAERSASDPAFLMDVMEVSERLSEAETDEQVREIKDENNAKLSATHEAIRKAFDAKDLAAAKEQVARYQFYENIATAVRNWVRGQPLQVHH